jgi:phospholipid/cholesterol/gamma-HCH transport system substrate-binding protein
METRANYVLIGVFTLAVVLGVFGFVYWFQNIGGTGERAFYRVQFEGSVSGLRTGATVLFNGIKVGEVTELKLDPKKPKQVIAGISIDKSVAVRADTEIGLEFQGLTGISALSLKGGDPAKPVLIGAKDNKDPDAPVLVAPPGATQDVTAAARDALRKVQELIEENQKSIKSALDQDAGRQSRQAHRGTDRLHRAVGQNRNADADHHRQGGKELRRRPEPDHLGRRAAGSQERRQEEIAGPR